MVQLQCDALEDKFVGTHQAVSCHLALEKRKGSELSWSKKSSMHITIYHDCLGYKL